MSYQKEALDKLAREFSAGSYDRYASAMKKAVRDALEDFCCQDEEFAQAVAQGGSFEECMKAVAKGCGSSISDLTAYKKAVQFYFPGAKVNMQLTIDLIGDAEKKTPDEQGGAKGVILDLWSLL